MALRKRWRGILRVAVVGMGATLITAMAYVVVQRHISRRQAEQLLADVRELQLRKSTWADAQELKKRWRAEISDDGPCSGTKCRFFVTVDDPFDRLAEILGYENPIVKWLGWTYFVLGRHFIRASADLTIHDSIITECKYEVWLAVPGNHFWSSDGSYGLVGIAEQTLNGFGPNDLIASRLLHPEYFVGHLGGCTGCMKVVTRFTPLAGRAKILELTDFNFDCITRWSPCQAESDIMPSAWRQSERESPGNSDRLQAFEECRIPLDFFGREYSEIAIADILPPQAKAGAEDDILGLHLRLIRRLKGQIAWPLDTTITSSARNRGFDTPGWSHADLTPGKRYILMADFIEKQTGVKQIELNDCGAVPFTEQNLTAIQKGIEESRVREAALSSP